MDQLKEVNVNSAEHIPENRQFMRRRMLERRNIDSSSYQDGLSQNMTDLQADSGGSVVRHKSFTNR